VALKPFAQAIEEHIISALRARLPVLREVVSMSEHEVLTIGDLVQGIREESKAQVADLENVHERVGRPADTASGSEAPFTMYGSMHDQQKAHAEFAEFCQSIDARLKRQEELARSAVMAVRQIAVIASNIDQIGMAAVMVTLNARVESAHMGAAGRRFDVIADELRDLSTKVTSSSSDIARISAQLMKIIPGIAEHAIELRESHQTASQALGERLAGVSACQRETLECVELTVRKGSERADRVVGRLHEVMGRLQFQDLISQRVASVANQEIASAKLMQRVLPALNGSGAEPADFAREAAAAEHISHACSVTERDERASESADDADAASGEVMML
jgi:methyl-accepting chemotaxis protein